MSRKKKMIMQLEMIENAEGDYKRQGKCRQQGNKIDMREKYNKVGKKLMRHTIVP